MKRSTNNKIWENLEIIEADIATTKGTLYHHANKWGPLASRVGDCISGDIAITAMDISRHYDSEVE